MGKPINLNDPSLNAAIEPFHEDSDAVAEGLAFSSSAGLFSNAAGYSLAEKAPTITEATPAFLSGVFSYSSREKTDNDALTRELIPLYLELAGQEDSSENRFDLIHAAMLLAFNINDETLVDQTVLAAEELLVESIPEKETLLAMHSMFQLNRDEAYRHLQNAQSNPIAEGMLRSLVQKENVYKTTLTAMVSWMVVDDFLAELENYSRSWGGSIDSWLIDTVGLPGESQQNKLARIRPRLEAFFDDWVTAAQSAVYDSTQAIFDDMRAGCGTPLGREGLEIFDQLVYAREGEDEHLGYSHSDAVETFIEAEAMSDHQERTRQILENTNHYLLTNGASYGAAYAIGEIFLNDPKFTERATQIMRHAEAQPAFDAIAGAVNPENGLVLVGEIVLIRGALTASKLARLKTFGDVAGKSLRIRGAAATLELGVESGVFTLGGSTMASLANDPRSIWTAENLGQQFMLNVIVFGAMKGAVSASRVVHKALGQTKTFGDAAGRTVVDFPTGAKLPALNAKGKVASGVARNLLAANGMALGELTAENLGVAPESHGDPSYLGRFLMAEVTFAKLAIAGKGLNLATGERLDPSKYVQGEMLKARRACIDEMFAERGLKVDHPRYDDAVDFILTNHLQGKLAFPEIKGLLDAIAFEKSLIPKRIVPKGDMIDAEAAEEIFREQIIMDAARGDPNALIQYAEGQRVFDEATSVPGLSTSIAGVLRLVPPTGTSFVPPAVTPLVVGSDGGTYDEHAGPKGLSLAGSDAGSEETKRNADPFFRFSDYEIAQAAGIQGSWKRAFPDKDWQSITTFFPGGAHRCAQAFLLTDATTLVVVDPQDTFDFTHERLLDMGAQNLEAKRIDRSDSSKNGLVSTLEFEFDYNGKHRKVIHYLHDAFDPDFWPAELREGIDAYYEVFLRSSLATRYEPSDAVKFNARVQAALNKGSIVMGDDSVIHLVGGVSPDPAHKTLVETLQGYDRVVSPPRVRDVMRDMPSYVAYRTIFDPEIDPGLVAKLEWEYEKASYPVKRELYLNPEHVLQTSDGFVLAPDGTAYFRSLVREKVLAPLQLLLQALPPSAKTLFKDWLLRESTHWFHNRMAVSTKAPYRDIAPQAGKLFEQARAIVNEEVTAFIDNDLQVPGLMLAPPIEEPSPQPRPNFGDRRRPSGVMTPLRASGEVPGTDSIVTPVVTSTVAGSEVPLVDPQLIRDYITGLKEPVGDMRTISGNRPEIMTPVNVAGRDLLNEGLPLFGLKPVAGYTTEERAEFAALTEPQRERVGTIQAELYTALNVYAEEALVGEMAAQIIPHGLLNDVPYVAQQDDRTCGIACFRMMHRAITGYDISEDTLVEGYREQGVITDERGFGIDSDDIYGLFNTQPFRDTYPGLFVRVINFRAMDFQGLTALITEIQSALPGSALYCQLSLKSEISDDGWHSVILLDVNQNSVIIHDPSNKVGAAYKEIPKEEFIRRWGYTLLSGTIVLAQKAQPSQ